MRCWRYLSCAITAILAGPALAQTSDELLTAADMDPAAVSVSAVTGDPRQYGIFTDLGWFKPYEGTDFVWLSTGVAGAGTTQSLDPTATTTQPGTNLGGSCTAADELDCVELSFDAVVPTGMQSFEIGFSFVTTEYPEFVGSDYNDALTISLVRPGVTYDNIALYEGAPMDANSVALTVPCGLLIDTGFELYSDLPEFDCDAAATPALTARAPVAPGETITVSILLRDRGDAAWDSAVLLDHFGFSPDPAEGPETDNAFHTLLSASPPFVDARGGTIITLSGRDLIDVTAVRVSPGLTAFIDVEDYEVVDENTITFPAPSHPPALMNVLVEAAPGGSPNIAVLIDAYQYTYFSQPPQESGCACSEVGSTSGSISVSRTSWGGILLLFGALTVLRRRRPRR